jgi:DNA-binding CsgD family transcriptional regulator
MGGRVDYVRKHFGPLQDKTLVNALSHCIGRQFPRIGGRRIRKLCAEMILEVVARHLRPREHLHHGQVLWMGISVDDPPSRGKRTAETELVPVVLDLSTSDDIEARIQRRGKMERQERILVRLCRQAHEQNALLSNCDLAQLLGIAESYVAHLLSRYEDRTGQVVPRRATVHDVGTGLTHKRIICYKRYGEGKTSEQIARETYHSLESVDRYLGQYDRVRHCRQEGMDAPQIAFTLNCSRSLVEQYLAIDRELEAQND